MNIASFLTRNAKYRPDHLGVVFEKIRLTFDEYNRSVNRLANALLSSGIGKGDKVVTFLPNSMEIMEVLWAVAKIGAVAVPLSPLLREKGLTNLINNSDAVLIITDYNHVPYIDKVLSELTNVRASGVWLTDNDSDCNFEFYQSHKERSSDEDPPYINIDSEDPFNIIYSSGTTGLPKGIVHNHFVRSMYGTLFSNYFRIKPESVILHTGALVFNGAFLSFMPSMFIGATYILHKQFDSKALVEEIIRSKVTHIVMVPSQIIEVLKEADFVAENVKSLEMILSVGAPLHVDYKKELNRRAPGVYYELYGLTEGFVTILDPTDFDKKPGSVGSPPQFFDMKIVDDSHIELPAGEVGEIIGRSPILMPEYYKSPEKTAEAVIDGWLYTGDMGYVDEDGYLFLVDRKKDLIISGGVNVYPSDIEDIINEHDFVSEVAVFGMPDKQWGETPVAAVLLKEGKHEDPEELKCWINDRLEARYQKVNQVVVLEEFPRSVAGKTLKRVIKEELLKGLEDVNN